MGRRARARLRGAGAFAKGAHYELEPRKLPTMLRLSCVLAAALATAACAVIPEDDSVSAAPPVAAGQISEATLKEVTRTLSSDAFEGRAPGTPGEEKTLAYLVREFSRVGLQPGNHGSWLQD